MEEVAADASPSVVIDFSSGSCQSAVVVLRYEALTRVLLLTSETGMQGILILFLNSIIHGQVDFDVHL